MKIIFTKIDEVYICSWPDIYFRGILLGGLFMELCGQTKIVCEKTGIEAIVEFKPKPMWGGEANEVEVDIKKKGKSLYTVTGKWDDKLYIYKNYQNYPSCN